MNIRAALANTSAPFIVFGALSLGCSVSAEEYSADQDLGSTHAAVRVQHVTDQAGQARGDALAGFVRVPAGAEPADVLALAGLRLELPRKGECLAEAPSSEGPPQVGNSELLEARVVHLETAGGIHELAPYAFPDVANLLRGVVYLSRDRSGEALPTGVTYTLLGQNVEADAEAVQVSSTQLSPSPPSGILAAGRPFSDSLVLAPAPVLDLSWESSGVQGDLIVVSLESEDDFWACSFSDGEGYGSVPLITDSGVELGSSGREGVLAVHRVRTVLDQKPEPLDQVIMTFDFAVEARIAFDAGAADLGGDLGLQEPRATGDDPADPQ